MSDYRHGWIVVGDNIAEDRRAAAATGWSHYDLETGKSTTWNAGADDRFGEPVFVPRAR